MDGVLAWYDVGGRKAAMAVDIVYWARDDLILV
jgi:hypothetical protein